MSFAGSLGFLSSFVAANALAVLIAAISIVLGTVVCCFFSIRDSAPPPSSASDDAVYHRLG